MAKYIQSRGNVISGKYEKGLLYIEKEGSSGDEPFFVYSVTFLYLPSMSSMPGRISPPAVLVKVV